MTGFWPLMIIDHINRNRLDNRWINLRDVTPTMSSWNRGDMINNTSGQKGACYHKQSGKWRVYLGRKHIGFYETREQAMLIASQLRTGLC